MRLQKFLAEAGVASRRASEKIILSGAVSVNGRVVQTLGSQVDPARDRVELGGKALAARRKVYAALHKPAGFICSRNDPLGRRSALDLLPPQWRHLNTVGRLDYNTEGLIFLTNDGEFALKITHPRFGVEKTYHAALSAPPDAEQLRALTRGLFQEGERLKAESVRVLKSGPKFSLIEVRLREGKNREVRRLLQASGLRLDRLKRVQIGAVALGRLPAGHWRLLTEREIKSLLLNGSEAAAAARRRRRI